jgi:hypothetical protein
LSKILSGIFWNFHLQRILVRIAGVSAEIQNKHLSDTSAEYYYTNQLGSGVLLIVPNNAILVSCPTWKRILGSVWS